MKHREVYFNQIKSGEKIYEIRLNDEKRKLITIGDTIVFRKEPVLTDTVLVKVVDLLYFKSFKQMVNILPLNKVGFSSESKQEVIDIYHKFYCKADEEKFGVLAIKVEI